MNAPTDGRAVPVERLVDLFPFSLCSRPSLARLVPSLTLRTLAPNERLYGDGDPVDALYVVLSGELELRRGKSRRREIALAGEEAGLELARRDGAVQALSTTRLLAIPAEALSVLATDNAAFRRALLDRFCQRESGEGQRVHRPRGALREGLGWLFAVLFPVAIYASLQNSLGQSDPEALLFLTIGAAAVVMWAFSLLPEFVPALLALLAVVLLGIAPAEIALSGFASQGFVVALSIFGLSVVIRSSGLSYRLLLWLLRIGPASKVWYRIALFATGVALTPIVPSANGRVSIVAPLLTDLLRTFEHGGDRERQRLAVTTLTGVSLLSAAFLSSKSINFVVFGFLPAQEQMRFQWLTWAYAASVVALVTIALYCLVDALLYRNAERPQLPKQVVAQQLALLGPVSRAEWAGLAGLLALIVSFVTTTLHHIEVPWVALAILSWLLAFGFIDRAQFRERIDWSFLVFLGALIGLMAVMRQVGVDHWMTNRLDLLGAQMTNNFEIFILLLAAAIFLVRIALPINATIVIFASILVPYAAVVGVNAWLVGFLILFFAESFILPYQASYYLQFTAISDAAQPAQDLRLIPFHLLLAASKPVAVYASIPFWRELGIL